MVAGLLGLKIVKIESKDGIIDIDETFIELYRQIRPYTMNNKFRCYALYKAVEYIIKKNITGDFVECGVWRGGNTMLIALLLKKYNQTNRKIFLYDTFSGMSEPTDIDKKTDGSLNATNAWIRRQNNDRNDWCYASLEEVENNMAKTNYPKENLIFVKGKVEETLQTKTPSNLALLRLDTDWYESTLSELTKLYPLLNTNGVIIIDDYGSWAGAKKAVDEYFDNIPLLFNRVDHSCLIGIKV